MGLRPPPHPVQSVSLLIFMIFQRARKDLHAPAVRFAAADFFVLPYLMRKFIHHLMDAVQIISDIVETASNRIIHAWSYKSGIDNVGGVKFVRILSVYSLQKIRDL